jgi:hypothetical protein
VLTFFILDAARTPLFVVPGGVFELARDRTSGGHTELDARVDLPPFTPIIIQFRNCRAITCTITLVQQQSGKKTTKRDSLPSQTQDNKRKESSLTAAAIVVDHPPPLRPIITILSYFNTFLRVQSISQSLCY